MREYVAAIAIACAAAVQAAPELSVYVDRAPSESEIAANFSGQRNEPRFGCLIGAFIDQDSSLGDAIKDSTGRLRRLPEAFEAVVGRPHAGYFFYLGYGSRVPEAWIRQLGEMGKVVHIALEPNNGLEFVRDDAYLRELAAALARTEARVLLRFASEMNGPWVAYNGNPQLYREKFRIVSSVIHKSAPNVAMVWCPYAMPVTPIARYYPGDDAVDWVGVNMYSVTYYNQNKRTPGKGTSPSDMLDFVYSKYSKSKPIMIGEYGATHYSNLEKKDQSGFAVRCINSLYRALPRRYPRVKAIFYFNGNNMELAEKQNNNYSVTQNPLVLSAYREVVSAPYFLERWAQSTRFFVQGIPFDIEPVDSRRSVSPGVAPMELRSGEVLRGRVRLSAWARDHLARYKLRITLNGKGLFFGDVAESWEREIDLSEFAPGKGTVTVEAFLGARRIVRKVVPVVLAS